MSGGNKTGVKNNGKTADKQYNEDVNPSLKQTIEEEAKRQRESPGSEKGIDREDKQSLERVFTKLSRLPYNKAKEITGYDGFALSPDEEELNGILMVYIVMYYMPEIDLGKFALYAFVILNIGLLVEKTIVYDDYKKKQEEAKKPKEIEDKTEKEKERNDTKGI